MTIDTVSDQLSRILLSYDTPWENGQESGFFRLVERITLHVIVISYAALVYLLNIVRKKMATHIIILQKWFLREMHS